MVKVLKRLASVAALLASKALGSTLENLGPLRIEPGSVGELRERYLCAMPLLQPQILLKYGSNTIIAEDTPKNSKLELASYFLWTLNIWRLNF